MNSTVYHISYSETSRRFYIALHWSVNLLDVASLQQFSSQYHECLQLT